MIAEYVRGSSIPEPVVHNSTPSQFPSARIVQHTDARLDRLHHFRSSGIFYRAKIFQPDIGRAVQCDPGGINGRH